MADIRPSPIGFGGGAGELTKMLGEMALVGKAALQRYICDRPLPILP